MKPKRVVIVAIVAVALLLVGCSAPARVDSGIRGTVTLGRVVPAAELSTAGPRPYGADLVIEPQDGSSSAAKVKSAPDGRFSLDLEPGIYVIRAADKNKSAAVLKPVTVTVEPHAYTEVSVPFDSGIR
jgi:hypothetical protein